MAALAFNLNYKAISPWREMGAYEALWDTKGPKLLSSAKLAKRFSSHPALFAIGFYCSIEDVCPELNSQTKTDLGFWSAAGVKPLLRSFARALENIPIPIA